MSDEKSAVRLRMPAGQVLTQKWPVLTYGETPRVDPANELVAARKAGKTVRLLISR